MADDPNSPDTVGHPKSADDVPDLPLIARYAAGEASASEAARFERWVNDSALRREMLEQLLASNPLEGETAVDVEAALTRIKAPRAPQESGASVVAREPLLRLTGGVGAASVTRRERTTRWIRRAAVAFGTMAALGLFWTRARPTPHVNPAPTMAEVRTRRGQRATVRLTDGTQVTLGPGSTLRYASDYGFRSREVSLEGQAFFDVQHDSAKTFLVRTKRALATDMGTKFEMVDRDSNRSAQVLVAEGTVGIFPAESLAHTVADAIASRAHALTVTPSTSGGPAVLRVGDRAEVFGTGQVRVEHDVPIDASLAWIDGRLVFRDTPVDEALAQLSLWYDVTVRLAAGTDSALARYPLTASVGREPLSQVLPLLAATLDATIERRVVEGDTVFTLRARRRR